MERRGFRRIRKINRNLYPFRVYAVQKGVKPWP